MGSEIIITDPGQISSMHSNSYITTMQNIVILHPCKIGARYIVLLIAEQQLAVESELNSSTQFLSAKGQSVT